MQDHSSDSAAPEPAVTSSAFRSLERFLYRHFDIAFYTCVILAAVWAFGAMLNNELFNDDFQWLRAARYDMTWSNVLGYHVIGFFRPLINLSFFLMEKLVPGNLAIYNGTQILLHVINTILVYQLFLRLLRDRMLAAVTAFYFLATFSHLGAVIWISARTTLMASAFLLSALLVAARPATPRRRAASLILFAFALLCKEEAIVGILLLPLLYWYANVQKPDNLDVATNKSIPANSAWYDRPTFFGFLGIAATYLAVRTILIGHMTQPNWVPGLHAFGNLAGSILGQFWPTLPLRLLGHSMIARPGDSLFWPEALAIPIVVAFLVAGSAIGRFREMLFAFNWLLICQLPTLFLNFRFLDMQSVMHTRYYYMSCIGTSLAVALLLASIWRAKRFPLASRAVAALLFLSICTNDILRTRNFEQRFSRGNLGVPTLVTDITNIMDEHRDVTTLVIGDSPFEMRYLSAAVLLERPALTILQSTGGVQGASQYIPCVYLGRSPQDKEQFALFVLK